MKIFIRADGGYGIGMGHVMRTLVLAVQLRKKNEVIFLCKKDEKCTYNCGIEKIKELDFDVIELGPYNIVKNIIKIQNEVKADMLITDSYDVNSEYFNELKEVFPINGYIDDVNKCYMNVDFLINQNINAKYMDYSKTTPKYADLLLGPKYSMLRDEFKVLEDNNIKKRQYVEDILLTLGGSDCNNNTLKVLQNMKQVTQRIHVVLGSAFDSHVKENIYNYAKGYSNIYLYENANMSELMKKCDIAISACGSTIYELCALRVPSIGIVLAENQKEVAELMKKEKIILDCFRIEKIEDENFKNSIDLMINDINIRDEIKKNGKDIVNVYGSEILSECIEKIYEIRRNVRND